MLQNYDMHVGWSCKLALCCFWCLIPLYNRFMDFFLLSNVIILKLSFQRKISIFLRALRAFHYFSNFQLKKVNFHSNLTRFSPIDPLFGNFTQKKKKKRKKAQFFRILHPMTSFFLRNPTPNDPVFVFR